MLSSSRRTPPPPQQQGLAPNHPPPPPPTSAVAAFSKSETASTTRSPPPPVPPRRRRHRECGAPPFPHTASSSLRRSLVTVAALLICSAVSFYVGRLTSAANSLHLSPTALRSPISSSAALPRLYPPSSPLSSSSWREFPDCDLECSCSCTNQEHRQQQEQGNGQPASATTTDLLSGPDLDNLGWNPEPAADASSTRSSSSTSEVSNGSRWWFPLRSRSKGGKKPPPIPLDPIEYWTVIGCIVVLVLFGGMFAGLTIGLMSIGDMPAPHARDASVRSLSLTPSLTHTHTHTLSLSLSFSLSLSSLPFWRAAVRRRVLLETRYRGKKISPCRAHASLALSDTNLNPLERASSLLAPSSSSFLFQLQLQPPAPPDCYCPRRTADETNLSILKRSGNPTDKMYAERIEPIRKDAHLLLVTLLLANTVVNETLPVLFHEVQLDGYQAVLCSTVLVLIFGEIIPQAVCARYGLQVGAMFAWPVRILIWIEFIIAYPVAKLLDYILGHKDGMIYRRAELKELIAMHDEGNQGPLSQEEVSILRAVLELRDKTVLDVMTKFEDVVMLPMDAKLDRQTIGKLIEAGHSRVPVYNNARENVIGVLLVKQLVLLDPDDATPLADIPIGRLPRIKSDTPLFEILHNFEEGGSHMAVVVDELPIESTIAESAAMVTASPLWIATLAGDIAKTLCTPGYSDA
ncbi:hypothetical protein DFJ73DRAFT_63328 [Zopfochytrium polystomum]|nr:hypothetical protein DFJ73DRAFT_63328 [Zopfochytrium polystomum]